MADLIIVDDEETLLRSLQLELKRLGHSCHAFETAEQAMHHLSLRSTGASEPFFMFIILALKSSNMPQMNKNPTTSPKSPGANYQ